MDNKPRTSVIIQNAIVNADRSQLWLSKQTGIPLTTLRRKLDGHSDFFLGEVARIASALELTPCELLPTEFCRKEVA